jgi:antitoxin Phd
MAIWKLQEAETRLSQVIAEATKKGPQIITHDGAECAVILSVEEYKALIAHKPDLRAFLLGGPKFASFEIERSSDSGREIDL